MKTTFFKRRPPMNGVFPLVGLSVGIDRQMDYGEDAPRDWGVRLRTVSLRAMPVGGLPRLKI
jgi:hypothetical protein